MPLQAGQEVFLAFATVADAAGRPHASVRKTKCLDPENRIFKCDLGIVTAMNRWSVETWHYTEAAAWRHCADVLRSKVEGVEAKAEECLQKAGAALAAPETVTV